MSDQDREDELSLEELDDAAGGVEGTNENCVAACGNTNCAGACGKPPI